MVLTRLDKFSFLESGRSMVVSHIAGHIALGGSIFLPLILGGQEFVQEADILLHCYLKEH